VGDVKGKPLFLHLTERLRDIFVPVKRNSYCMDLGFCSPQESGEL